MTEKHTALVNLAKKLEAKAAKHDKEQKEAAESQKKIQALIKSNSKALEESKKKNDAKQAQEKAALDAALATRMAELEKTERKKLED